MQFKKSVLLLLTVILLQACSAIKYTKQESVFIVFKTPTFKYADLGFIYENTEEVKVEMYSNGQAILALEIGKENVCMSLFECMDKQSFNQNILSRYYPTDILSHIFKAQKIFSNKNVVKTRNGFTQQLVKKGQYHINYSVLNKQVIFRDTINDILIKVKRLK